MYRIVLKLHLILLIKIPAITRKIFTVPFLKYKRLKLKLRVFLAGQCCYGNLLCHENNTNVFISDLPWVPEGFFFVAKLRL